MKKRVVFALSLAIVFPLICFFFVKYYSEKNVFLPKKYFFDNIILKKENGKLYKDTIWHKVSDIKLRNQLNQEITLDKYKDKILILHFFYTRCSQKCLSVIKNIKFLQQSFKKKVPIVQLLSITVDTKFDTPEQLKQFADSFQINYSNWDLLTGMERDIYNFAEKELKISVERSTQNHEQFFFSDKCIVLDKNRRIRGFYKGSDSNAIYKLAKDVVFLYLEKYKTL